MKRALVALALLLAPVPAIAEDAPVDNPEMAAIYAADQAPRQGGAADWEAVSRADSERRARTRALIEQGLLTTAPDFYRAAYVFQHGDVPDDQLFAHVLAVRALALGLPEAEEIVAATLDRYLQRIGRSQVYGSQFSYSTDTGSTQEPYDKALIPDALRRAMGAPTVAEQEARMAEMEATMKAVLPQPE